MRFGAFLRGVLNGSRADPEAAGRVKAWAQAALRARDGTAIAVNEIACTDPACPRLETVVLVMEPGRKTRAVKVSKAMEVVTEQDIREALVS